MEAKEQVVWEMEVLEEVSRLELRLQKWINNVNALGEKFK